MILVFVCSKVVALKVFAWGLGSMDDKVSIVNGAYSEVHLLVVDELVGIEE